MQIITRIPKKLIVILMLLMLSSSVILLKGCGSSNDSSTGCRSDQIAPFDATITVGGGFTGSAGSDTPVYFTAVVKDKSGNNMNGICLQISGNFAYPRNAATTGWHYEFHRGVLDPLNPSPIVNSPFSDVTDNFGKYDFSALYSVATGTFTDTVTVRSGSVQGTAAFSVN
jgi:hypothetical protein